MTAFSVEEQSRRKRMQIQQAQQLAASGEWQAALDLNNEFLNENENDVAALNRIGKALSELGRYGEAHASYGKSLELDPANQIARRNLQRLEPLKDQEGGDAQAAERRRTQARRSMFIEEIGKTRVVELVELADNTVLAKMTSGDQVDLRVEGRKIVLYSEDGLRLGRLDARLAQRLLPLIEGGNRYSAAVTAVEAGMLRVIVRETYQHPSLAGRLSFPVGNKPAAPRAYTRATASLYGPEDKDFLSDDDDADDNDDNDTNEEEEFNDDTDATSDDTEEEQTI